MVYIKWYKTRKSPNMVYWSTRYADLMINTYAVEKERVIITFRWLMWALSLIIKAAGVRSIKYSAIDISIHLIYLFINTKRAEDKSTST